MHVMAISTVTDRDGFWASMKTAYGQLPAGAKWLLAVASSDGTRAVNILVHDSVESVRQLFDEHASGFGATECFEADAANAVGLGTK